MRHSLSHLLTLELRLVAKHRSLSIIHLTDDMSQGVIVANNNDDVPEEGINMLQPL